MRFTPKLIFVFFASTVQVFCAPSKTVPTSRKPNTPGSSSKNKGPGVLLDDSVLQQKKTNESSLCGYPDIPSNGGLTRINQHWAVYSCNYGYTLYGDSVMRCESGRWNGVLPRCVPIECATPLYRHEESLWTHGWTCIIIGLCLGLPLLALVSFNIVYFCCCAKSLRQKKHSDDDEQRIRYDDVIELFHGLHPQQSDRRSDQSSTHIYDEIVN